MEDADSFNKLSTSDDDKQAAIGILIGDIHYQPIKSIRREQDRATDLDDDRVHLEFAVERQLMEKVRYGLLILEEPIDGRLVVHRFCNGFGCGFSIGLE